MTTEERRIDTPHGEARMVVRRARGAVATLRPATRHGCSNSTTETPWAGSASASAHRSRDSMPPPAPWLSSSVAMGLVARRVWRRPSPWGVSTVR
ncbi:MAG TPA: hypothetical protein VFY76_08790, partial [Nocardioides sp.]|nr:hypothetical protein [Nocardioides sp.]